MICPVARSVAQPIARPISDAINAAIQSAYAFSVFSPLALFSGGADGGWYDPSDLTTLFQDSAGTVPVTTSGQPVGKMLDKSGNNRHLTQATAAARPTYASGHVPATFGAELTTNGTFASDTAWTKGGTWTIGSGVASAGGSSGTLSQAVTVTAGKLYRLTFTVSAYVAGTVTPNFSGGTTTSGQGAAANGTFTIYMRAETGNTTLGFAGAGSPNLSIDNVSLMEVLTFTGYPCLFFDGNNDALFSAATFTIQLPVFLSCAMLKPEHVNQPIFGATLNTTNYAQIRNVSTATERMSAGLRETTFGAQAANTASNAVPADTPAVVSSLCVVGTCDVSANRATPATAANTWVAETTIALTALGINISASTGTAAIGRSRFFGGVILKGDPGATNRAKTDHALGLKIGLSV